MSQKYQFPIKKSGTNSGTSTDYTYDEIMDALDDSGHYILGKNNRWHGGVHYKQAFSEDVTERIPVYAIGKGTIVAYRLKKEESTLQAFDPIQETKYDYSSSFVLIKHELRVNIEAEETEENASIVLGNQLNDRWSNQEVTLQGNGQQIYNSADLNTYNRDPLNENTTITLTGVDPVLVNFGDHESYVIRGRRSNGTDVWLEGFDANGNVLEADGTALLTPNNPDAVNTPSAEDTNDEGTKLLIFYSLYMHLAHYEEYQSNARRIRMTRSVNIRSYDHRTGSVGTTPLRTCNTGDIFTTLGGSFSVGNITYNQIATNEVIAVKNGNTDYAEVLEGLSRPIYWPEGNTPPELNSVITCEIPVEKGALIGHLGIFEIPTSATGGKNQKHQVHIEIFTEDNAEFEKFYRNDRNLFQDQKYIRLRDGYTISTQMSDTASDTNTLHTVTGEHVLKLDISDVMTTDSVEYYRLLNIPATVFRNNPTTTGYIRKDSLRGTGVFCQHDWDQLGFTLVKENNDNADGFINVPETPQFFQDIDQNISETTLPDENDQLVRGTDEFNLAALKFRLNDKLFRDRWSKIIAKHPTEWEVDGEHDRWQLLKDIFETVKNKSNIEQHERERIANLVFWDDLGEKPSQSNLLHFHPMTFVNNLLLPKPPLITLKMLKASLLLDVNRVSNRENELIGYLPYLNYFADMYGVTNQRSIIHYLSQTAHESSFIPREGERLNYRAVRMRQVFGCQRNVAGYDATTDDCREGFTKIRPKLWTHENTYAHNPENLANYVYANRMGNGNEESGDGYRYRGRGLIQLTGRVEYATFTRNHNNRNPEDLQNFEQNPDLLISNPIYAIESSFSYWFSKPNLLNASTTGSVERITQIVNGGQNGYADRRIRFNRISQLLGTTQD